MTQPPMNPNYQMQPQSSSGLAIAALVMGIVSIVLTIVIFCIPFIGGGVGLIAVILGGMAVSQKTPGAAAGKGKAKAGLIMGIISILLAIAIIAAAHAGINFLNKNAPKWQQQMQEKEDELKKQADEDAQKKTIEDQQKTQSQTQP